VVVVVSTLPWAWMTRRTLAGEVTRLSSTGRCLRL
jgi:hypothetical protein